MTHDDVIQIADKSPLPVLIYSYPGVSGGIDITSDSVATLSKHKNIVGIKQTDHNVGKMARIYYETRQNNFLPFAGASDYLLGALAVGAHGCITGLGNITPRVILQLFDLYEAGDLVAARELQGLISVGEWATLAGGVPSMKVSFVRSRENHLLIIFRHDIGCIRIIPKPWRSAQTSHSCIK